MDDEKKSTTWKESWETWFNSSESNEAKGILETVGRQEATSEASSAPEYVVHELKCMKKLNQAATGADIRKSLSSMTLEELRQHVQGNMVGLDHEIGQWKARRQHGPKKTARKIEEFAQEFDTFLAGFSGIVEVVKLVDNQYSGAASAVLFILFATAKAKARNDRSILSSMQLLAHRLPDLEIYYQVYADGTLAKMLSRAYSDVISFARSATLYFQGHGFARFMKGLIQPKAFLDLEQDMARNFQEIRFRCDALVSKRISDLSDKNTGTDLLAKVGKLDDEIRDLHKRADEETAHLFRKSMLRRHESEPTPKSAWDDQLVKYGLFLKKIFSDYDDLTAMTRAGLQQTPEYRHWEGADASILILYGRNHGECTCPQSWLSPVAVDYTLDRVKSSTDTGIIVTHVIGRDEGTQKALASISDQLVEQEPQVVRCASATDNISSLADVPTLDVSGRILTSIMNHCSRPVYILIDRLDICCGKETWAVMRLLINLVAETQARLKILLVLRMDLWNIEERMDSVDQNLMQSKKLILLRKDQEELLDC